MDLWQAVVFSIVEGVTEFLPISSTGHLILTAEILKIPQTAFVKSFEIAIQLGAIVSIVVLYFRTLLQNKKIWLRILAAFIPTAVLGALFYRVVKDILLGNLSVTLSALFLGGIALIFLEKIYKEKGSHTEKLENVTFKQAFSIGICQSISMIPGVSRAGATIIGGMFLGLKRQTATEFSFLLAIPTMLAATVLDLSKSNFQFSSYEYLILSTGFIGSFISALLVVKFFINYVKKNTFVSFGVYRIILSVIFWLVII